MINSQFVILTFPRTGSSTLADALRIHDDIYILGEPFHPVNEKDIFRYITQVHSLDSFKATLDLIFKNYQGIKHMIRHVPFEYNRYIISSGEYKLVYLYREKALPRIMSMLISRNIRNWDRKDLINNHDFEPFNLKQISNMINSYKNELNLYLSELNNAGRPFFILCYEDLYNSDRSIESKINIIIRLYKFLGYESNISPEQINKLSNILNYRNKMNNYETYMRIPNINDIEKKFGSVENGYLLK